MKEILKSTDGFSTMSFDELVLVNGGSDQIYNGHGLDLSKIDKKDVSTEEKKGDSTYTSTSGNSTSGGTGSK